MASSMVYRLKAGAVEIPAMMAFREAMRTLQTRLDNHGYNHIAGFHGAPGWYCWHHQSSRRAPVPARLFLPWHRAYLWWLEQALQDVDEQVGLAWWDWTKERRIPPAYHRRTIDNQPNPLNRFKIRVPATATRPAITHTTRRSPSTNSWGRLPTVQQIDEVLRDTDWASFSDRLQDYHDRVHVWMGGDMSDSTTAAFDPIFFAHHCMIDRVWYLWQVRHGSGGVPQDLLNMPLLPFGKTVREVLDVQALGYEYAATATPIPIV